MQIAYFDCLSGISGDMTLAGLIDAGADLGLIQDAIDSMGLPGVRLSTSLVTRHGFRGKFLSIEHPVEHVHRTLREIHVLIRRARISIDAKDLAMRFFERIARAEAKVHGTSIDRVHFHEVGAIDSIVDMVGVAVAWDSLKIERAFASAIPTGMGQIQIAHGKVNVPAPATAELLIGVPIAPTEIPYELTTPTGAAIITELTTEFGAMPSMQVSRIGYGAGKRDVKDRPNLLRILVGTAISASSHRSKPDESVIVIECNLDDITGEQIGFAIERLWNGGALDVFTTPIQMKKNRPGVLLTVLAKPVDRLTMESILFRHTGTLGVRYRKQSRTVLPRANVDVQTPWGIVIGKVSKLPTGEENFSPEFEDCSTIAKDLGLRLGDVIEEVSECYYAERNHTLGLEVSEEPLEDDETETLPTREPIGIDSVNAVFRQAAFEDEYENPVWAEQPVAQENLSPSASDIAFPVDERPHLTEQPPNVQNNEAPSTNPNEYYRWDSSPWSEEITNALPPAKAPKEFPL